MSTRKLRLAMTGWVLLHLVVVSVHGFSHHRLGVDLEIWQQVFVGTVILAGPLAALAVSCISRLRLGTILLAISMAGSSAFGICYHFFLSTPDNIFLSATVGRGHWFAITAVLLSIIETACCVWCVWILRCRSCEPAFQRRRCASALRGGSRTH